MMILTIDGIAYTQFTKLNVTQSMEEFAGVFSFTAIDVEGTFNRDDYPIKMGALARVLIDDVPVLTGYVEIIDIEEDSKTHTVSISGRDLTCDLVDSSVAAELDFSAQTISLEKIIDDAQNLIGLSLPIINEVEDLTDFNEDTIISSEVNGTIFEFLEPFARKKGVLLTTDGNGSIVITRGSGSSLGKFIFNLVQDGPSGNNNIIKSHVTYDFSERFSEYIVGSQLNLQALSDSEALADDESIVNSVVSVTDTEMSRNTRKLYIIAEEVGETLSLSDRVNWEANLRKTRSRVYEATVVGHTVKPGVPYWFNKKAIVIDDPMGISEEMLIQSVSFSESIEDGELTTLTFVARDSYTLLFESSASDSDTNKFGAPFELEKPLTAESINTAIQEQISISASDTIDENA